jgi:hypothetical protein
VTQAQSYAALAFLACAATAQAEPHLSLPADCTLGETCFIQQYPDTDPGPGAQDYMCGPLSYDGHKGTDFGLPSLAAMRAGVAVIAPADGTVLRIRSNMPDRLFNADTADTLKGRDCGNGMVIDIGDGWETQLCHMRQDSLTVRPGDKVARGDKLGLVGLSGRTQFPHVHLSLLRDGRVVDPFRPAAACGGPVKDSLWADPPAYQPGGLLSAGFATNVPSYDAVKDGSTALERLTTDAPALVAWGYGFGARAGDVIRLTITGPDGTRIFEHEASLERAKAQFFRAGGRKARAGDWRPGTYTAEARLLRDGAVIDTATDTIIAN